MSFWTSRTGKPITGSDADSFVNHFPQIPDNTQANAVIKSFTVNTFEGEKSFQVIWQIVDGEFRGSQVKQSIRPYEIDDNKAQRNLNMLMRLFNLCNHKPSHGNEPTNDDLAPMKGTILCIKTGAGVYNGREFTNVREVHPEGTLEVETGYTNAVVAKPDDQGKIETAFTREAERKAKQDLEKDDIPF